MYRFGFILLVALFLTGCATAGRQTREVLALPTEALPRSGDIDSVPFINQPENYCGPATLAMVMQWAGRSITVDEIAPDVFTKGGKGALQTDLISASRRRGMIAIPLEGMQPMLQEIAAGHPVIVLENLGIGWFPKWHYSVVHGYDLDKQQLHMHSGAEANAKKYLNHFERGSKLADYWSLVVLPPDQLSATAGVLAHVRAAAGLELAQQTDEAEQAYSAILTRWPDHLAALIGIGNVAYKKKDYQRAAVHLRKAVKLYPDSAQAKHNLSVAEAALTLRPDGG